MDRRVGVMTVAVGLAALAVGIVAPAAGVSRDGHRVIRVSSKTTESDFLDLGAKGYSLGDEFIFASTLHKHGKQVGHAGVVCTTVSVEREESQCVATTWLHAGQITVQGLVAGEPGGFTVPVTGGSGKYEGVEGELHVRTVSNTEEILTFHLQD